MTISKGSNLTITTGGSLESIAAFSSSQAGVAYTKPGVGGTASGFLLDISGTTVTKAGSQTDLHTAATGPFQRVMIHPVSASTLNMLTVDSSASPVADIVPITKTATQLVGGTPLTLSTPTDIDSGAVNAVYDFDGNSLCTLLDTTQSFWYLTLSDGSSQGNVVTFNPTPAAGSLLMGFAQFSTTSGVLCYFQGTTFDYVGLPLTKSGLTLSAGTPFTINSTNVDFSGLGPMAACQVSSNRILAGYIDLNNDKNLQTIDSPTTVNANTVITASTVDCWLERFHGGSAVIYADTGVNCDWSEVTIAAGGGLTHTNTVAGSGTGSNNARGAMSRLDNSHIITCFAGAGTLLAAVLTTDVASPAITSNEFTAAPMTSKPCDIDADGTNIYIGALASDTTPILIQFATALNVNGNVVFQPGSGDNIGVECSRGDGDEVTVAGQFDGTNVVERSEDAGSTFSVIDDTTIGGVASFIVGPDSDNRIMVFDEDNFDILETIDEGTTWVSNNASVSQVLRVLARLGIDVNQLIAGTSSADSAQVLHSPNAGAELEDIELDAFGLPNRNINGILIN